MHTAFVKRLIYLVSKKARAIDFKAIASSFLPDRSGELVPQDGPSIGNTFGKLCSWAAGWDNQ